MVNNRVSLASKVCIIALALFLLPAFVFAQQPSYGFHKGDYEFTLSGSGSSDKDLDNTVFATSFGIGYFFTDNFEAAVRQGIAFADFPGDNGWAGSTMLAVDYHIDLERFQPLIGVSAGYIYGNSESGVNDTWAGGPEAGVKYFINQTTFVSLLVQYNFSFRDDFDEGLFIYGLGLGVRF